MASRSMWLGAAALAALTVASSARAEPSAADRETARSLMDQGRELRDKGDLKEAMKRFKAADDIMHVPTTALPLAKVQVALGLLVEARDTLASSMRLTPEKPSDPQPFKDARAEGEQLDASLAGRVPALTVLVKGAAASDRPALSIDGVAVPAAALGLPRAVDPGHHVIVATTTKAQGRKEVDVREGEQKSVEIELSTSSGYEEPTGPALPFTSLARVSHAPDTLTWVGIAGAGAGVLVGSVTGLLAITKAPTLSSECANHVCGPSAHSDLASANTLATVSDVAFAVAGAGALVAVVSLLVGHEAPNEASTPPSSGSSPTAHGWVGIGSAGLHGSF